jgi:hypothetical protein
MPDAPVWSCRIEEAIVLGYDILSLERGWRLLEDNRSDSKAADALREFQQTDSMFYSINPSGPAIRLNEISKKGQKEVASIAAETGGTAFVSDISGDLKKLFKALGYQTIIAHARDSAAALRLGQNHTAASNIRHAIAMHMPNTKLLGR